MPDESRGEPIAGFGPHVKREAQLPAAFDMQCRSCKVGTLALSDVPLFTRRQPFAVLHCNSCNDYLYLFGTLEDPLKVHGSELRGSCNFSADIDERFEQRALDRERKMLQSTGILLPP